MMPLLEGGTEVGFFVLFKEDEEWKKCGSLRRIRIRRVEREKERKMLRMSFYKLGIENVFL